ncbi:MAG: DUF4861 domain-containing protein [Prolixibacteraceae bacterium]|nr:DUF4861 domain-containing protein [Prolixibacteraceae bacterium]MBT6004826.1 DUF4861 domain-containing protein [Prolixibacteraceae bacterium]MBT6764265.1 DUF4861 domain-containing protein [Prolixibacteraceae bacterium]MBT7000176.1 DUF4861 domain-containing protein [Prolixibacteraceae bacterium]MBT7396233.1 DUF4861 domain-containing protein [Prolixibacteraceae bacterium]
MKIIYFLFITAFLFSCEKEAEFSFSNTMDVTRNDEIIILTKDELAQKVKLQEGLLPVFKLGKDIIVSSQVDDLDGDGKWDEVVLLLDFAANETLELKVELVTESEYPEFDKRTNLSLKIVQEDGSYKEFDNYQALPCDDGFEIIAMAESVNWENDKIAFRNYFDCRNVKDLFGKLLPGMVLDKIGTPEMGSYHNLSDWGMDVLHCGSSLGSGGLALLTNDSLFRLGSTKVYEYQKIVEGPVRSIFELRYKGWDVDGEMLEAVERISIYPGKYWFESDVTVTGCSEESQIVTGIVTSHLKREPFKFEAGNFQCIGTHGVQSLNKDELGMAVIVPISEAGEIDRTTDINFYKLGYETVVEKKFSNIISETYYIGQNYKSDVSAKHYFFSVWGLDKEQWKTEKGFIKYITEEADKLSEPISIL